MGIPNWSVAAGTLAALPDEPVPSPPPHPASEKAGDGNIISMDNRNNDRDVGAGTEGLCVAYPESTASHRT